MTRRSAIALVLLAALAACAPVSRTTFPPAGSTPAPPGGATTSTTSLIVAALATQGLQAVEADRPFRPSEGALLAAAPRTNLRVTLPDDPEGAFIVVYALASPEAAQAAAADHASYLASGVGGGVQYPPGTEFVLRVVGSTVVFFSWLPANSPDSRTATIASTLAAIGTEVPIPA